MSGSKTVSATSKELHAMRARGESLSRPLPKGASPALDDPDNPDCTAAVLDVIKRAGRPRAENPKVFTGIRLDAEVLEAFRATGKGWQTRMNEALKDWLKTHKIAS